MRKIKDQEIRHFTIACIAVAVLVIIMIITRQFYTVEKQTVSYNNYTFKGVSDGSIVTYTLVAVPEKATEEIGDIIYGDGTDIFYNDKKYDVQINKNYLAGITATNKKTMYITFPDSKKFVYSPPGMNSSSTSRGIWLSAGGTAGTNNMFEQPRDHWHPNLIAAAALANERFLTLYNNPREWNGMATFVSIIILILCMFPLCCPRKSASLDVMQERIYLHKYYDLQESEVKLIPSERLLSIIRLTGGINVFISVLFLLYTFYT